MKKLLFYSIAFLLVTSQALAQQKTIWVAPTKVSCTGAAPMQCLQYKYQQDEQWKLMYGGIEGFQHENGYAYKLLILEEKIENPPADGSSIKRTLIQIVERKKVLSMNQPFTMGNWQLTHLLIGDNLTDVSTHAYMMHVSDSGFSARVCNNMHGKLVFENDGKLLNGPVMSTKMMCQDIKNEDAFLNAIQQGSQYEVSNGVLELKNNGKVLARFMKAAQKDDIAPAGPAAIDYRTMLANNIFIVKSITDESGTSDMLETKATMHFDTVSNRVSGKAGCNNYFAQAILAFTADNKGSLKMSKGGSTMMACPKYMDLEQRLLKLLEQADGFEMNQNTMKITKAGNTIIELMLQ